MFKKIAGFTLVEMLIVVGIIAILASIILLGLAPARQASRDARRIADLREVQTVLETYYNKCSAYPGGGTSPSASCTNTSVTDWTSLQTALKTAGVATVLPIDPLNKSPNQYAYAVSGSGQSYTLSDTLEDPNNLVFGSSLKGTYNGVVCGTPIYCAGQ